MATSIVPRRSIREEECCRKRSAGRESPKKPGAEEKQEAAAAFSDTLHTARRRPGFWRTTLTGGFKLASAGGNRSCDPVAEVRSRERPGEFSLR